MSAAGDALEALCAVITNTLNLINQLEPVVSSVVSQKPATNSSETESAAQQLAAESASVDVLSLAQASATLIKAHATKVSLLIINEPFTPTAITKVLQELIAGPVSSLAAAVQACTPERYTWTIQKDLAWRVKCVLSELKTLVSRIPTDGKVLSGAKKHASVGAAGGRGSITTTGVLWSACDDVVTFAQRGFAGNLAHKVDQLRDTLKDVMAELKAWGEETEDGDDDDDGDGAGGENNESSEGDEDGVAQITSDMGSASISTARDPQDIVDDLMNSQQRIPRDDPNKIRERWESCCRRLRLTILLYQAAVKRRISPLPHVPPGSVSDVPARLDEVMTIFKRIPERFEDLAMAFYDLDPSEIDRLMDECFFDAFAASELLVKPWDGQKDEFTDWALRFQAEIKKV